MFASGVTHRDQLERVAGTFRDLYDSRRTGREAPAGNGSSAFRPSTPVRPGRRTEAAAAPDRQRELRRRLFARIRREMSVRMRPGVACPRCGMVFPAFDREYTEYSGLCIPCWETMVI